MNLAAGNGELLGIEIGNVHKGHLPRIPNMRTWPNVHKQRRDLHEKIVCNAHQLVALVAREADIGMRERLLALHSHLTRPRRQDIRIVHE